MPLVTPQMPDISGLDLPGSLMSRLGASGHTEASNYQHSGANQLRTGPPAVEPDLEAAAPVSANDISANEQESANQIHWNVANNQSVQGEAESNSLLQRAVEEKESIQQVDTIRFNVLFVLSNNKIVFTFLTFYHNYS